ncbi:MAG: ThuA domain-containing protein, partial [Bacteroidota bacterium]
MNYRLILVLSCLYLVGCAATQAPRETLRAPRPQILLIQGKGQDLAMQEAVFDAVFPLTQQLNWRIDTTSDLDFIHSDSLHSYGVLLLSGVAGEILTPYQQRTIERHVQSGAALGLIHSAINQRLTWHWLDQVLQEKAAAAWTPVWSEEGTADPIYARDYDGGRVFKSYPQLSTLSSTAWKAHMAEALTCAMGDHLYRPYQVHSPPAPRETQFTFKVLDADLNEPMELAVMPGGKVLFTERRGILKMYDP